MSDGAPSLTEWAARIVEAGGVAVIVGGAVLGLIALLVRVARKQRGSAFRFYRHYLGRAILLGLELLVGADIIRTVTRLPSLDDVVVLAAIILIRTFLSFTLELELEGRWPWQKNGGF